MAVLLETSKGDLVIDLYTDECPLATKNFLKLCKIKYYNDVLFWSVQKGFIAQTGDPTGTSKGGSSIYGVLYGEQARCFEDEIHPHIKHKKKGMVGMASGAKDANASQFYITTGTELDSLDEKHTIFGEVSEGLDTLEAIDDAFVDDNNRPLQNIRLRHTIILDDPFEDPPQLEEHIPENSPEPVMAEGDTRLEDDWVPDQDQRSMEEIEESNRKKEAKARAVVLEMIGDLPEADAKPPTNMLFVCKLNPVTTEEDLEIIFSRFGNITSCDIIRDYKTGDSLCYAFIGFDSDKASEDAYFKMNNVLIDDRRIKVDFSQSVSHLWRQFKRFGNKADATAGESANSGAPGGGRGGACFQCGELGHLARECPNGKGGGKGPSGAGANANGNGNALALKDKYRQPLQHGGGRQDYGLVLDGGGGADKEAGEPLPPRRDDFDTRTAERSRSHRDAGPRDERRHRSDDGHRNGDRGSHHERSDSRHQDRVADVDRHHERHRDRRHDPAAVRGRERERERSRERSGRRSKDEADNGAEGHRKHKRHKEHHTEKKRHRSRDRH